jgi:excisionase family DNA binding protein
MPDALPVPAPVAAPLPPPDPDRFLTLKEAARRLNVTIRYVRQLRQSGALPVVRLSPRRLRVRPEDLERYIHDLMTRAARRGAAR